MTNDNWVIFKLCCLWILVTPMLMNIGLGGGGETWFELCPDVKLHRSFRFVPKSSTRGTLSRLCRDRLPRCVCPKMKDMGPFLVSRE